MDALRVVRRFFGVGSRTPTGSLDEAVALQLGEIENALGGGSDQPTSALSEAEGKAQRKKHAQSMGRWLDTEQVIARAYQLYPFSAQNLTREHALKWLEAAPVGTCGRPTTMTDEDALPGCRRGVMGQFSGFSTQHHADEEGAALSCLKLCNSCARCQFISFSFMWKECSWFYACSLTDLDGARGGFKSGVAIKTTTPLSTHLSPCINRRHLNYSLEACEHISPAGSGSTYLTNRLAEVATYFNWSKKVQKYHTHMPKSARCLVIPLRDPVERIESGFRHELMGEGSEKIGKPRLTARFSSASRMARALRIANHSMHDSALLLMQRSQNKHISSDMGSSFLTPQSNYIPTNARCTTHEVHVLCTSSLPMEYRRLLWTFNVSTPSLLERSESHEHFRMNRSGSRVLKASTIAPADAHFLRSSYYREDWALYRSFCRNRNQGEIPRIEHGRRRHTHTRAHVRNTST